MFDDNVQVKSRIMTIMQLTRTEKSLIHSGSVVANNSFHNPLD